MSGLPQDPDASDPMPDLVVPLPPEILAMMASFEAASTDETEAAADVGLEVDSSSMRIEAPRLDAAADVEHDDGATLVLAPVLDLTAAAALHTSLLATRGAPLMLDASSVKRLGGQCLQLLISAGLTWKADGVALALGGRSEAFDRDLALLGVRETKLFEEAA